MISWPLVALLCNGPVVRKSWECVVANKLVCLTSDFGSTVVPQFNRFPHVCAGVCVHITKGTCTVGQVEQVEWSMEPQHTRTHTHARERRHHSDKQARLEGFEL